MTSGHEGDHKHRFQHQFVTLVNVELKVSHNLCGINFENLSVVVVLELEHPIVLLDYYRIYILLSISD